MTTALAAVNSPENIPDIASIRALESFAPANTSRERLLVASKQRSKRLDCVPACYASDGSLIVVVPPGTSLNALGLDRSARLFEMAPAEVDRFRERSYRYAVPSPQALYILAKTDAVRFDVFPLAIEGQSGDQRLVVGAARLHDQVRQRAIEAIVHMPLRVLRLDLDDIKERRSRFYEATISTDSSAITRLTNEIVSHAIRARVSDVHVDPITESAGLIRFSVDGKIEPKLTREISMQTVTALHDSLLNKADIVQASDTSQGHNARLTFPSEGRPRDLRISTVPCIYGPSLHIRFASAPELIRTLEEAGMVDPLLSRYKRILSYPKGMVGVAAPMGEGKTSLVHTSMRTQAIWMLEAELGRAIAPNEQPDWKLLPKTFRSIEDPVENRLPWVIQTQVDSAGRLKFIDALRQFVRMNVWGLLVGEIRDDESLQIAVQASLLGHYVFTTFHADDVMHAVRGLRARGASLEDLASGLIAILSQRLVKRLCTHCREQVPRADLDGTFVELVRHHLGPDREPVAFRSRGCQSCHGGYTQRFAVFELFEITRAAEEAIIQGGSMHELVASDPDFRPLAVDAFERVLTGHTSISEIRRFIKWTAK